MEQNLGAASIEISLQSVTSITLITYFVTTVPLIATLGIIALSF